MPSAIEDVKLRSPYDAEQGCRSAPPVSAPLVSIGAAPDQGVWKPSRFNARTTDDDGNTIIWNSKTGAISVFPPAQKSALEPFLTQEGYAGRLGKFGEYLKERGFLVPAEAHEFRQFETMFGEQHFRTDVLELILLASEDCNFRCRYCYEDFKRGTMRPDVRARVKKLVEKRAPTLRNLGVSWFGGEPLYGFAAIEDLSPFFLDVAAKKGWNFSASMTTNGYLLFPETAEKLLAWHVDKFQITIDGPPEQHNRNRPGRDGSGTFSTIYENLKALKSMDADFFVRLRINFDPVTHPHLEELLCMFEESFGHDDRFGLAFYAAGKWGGPNDDDLEVCGAKEFRQVRARLEASASKKGLKYGTMADANRPGGQVCYAARPFNYVIGADGKVMKCTVALDTKEHNIVGSISDDGDILLNYENYALWVEPAFATDTTCHKCHMLPSCQGISCPLIRIEEHVRPCENTIKHNLHNELVGMVKAKQGEARRVQMARPVAASAAAPA